jgi:hypothetical protein
MSELTILFREDFTDPQSGWRRGYTGYRHEAEYKEGEMVLSKKDNIYNPFAYARPNLSFDNFVLEVDARWSGGAVGGEYGVIFRYGDEDNYYLLRIGNDGRYVIGKRTNGNWLKLQEGFSGAIDRLGGVNQFHLEAKGPKTSFFINDDFLSSIHDVDHNLGDILLAAWLPTGTPFFEASFDNVVVARHP